LKAAAVKETPLRITDRHCEDSMRKKRDLQKKDHKRMIKQRRDSVNTLGVSPGAVVIVKVDSRDVSHAMGIPGIVWMVGNGSGVRVAMAHGIISSGNQKGVLYLGHDKWSLHCGADKIAVLEPEL
jgi:hypothetical protein